MCRSIKNLYNFEPKATEEEIRNATIQFVRKIVGLQKPNPANIEAMNKSIEQMTRIIQTMFDELSTTAKPKNRDIEITKARKRSNQRFGTNQL